MRLNHPWRTRFAQESGFTLIELLGVAVIIIILSLMALPVYAGITDKAREAKSSEDLRVIEQALEAYHADMRHSHYPKDLKELVTEGYLKPSTFESPWSGEKNVIYYYYAVDRAGDDVATYFVLADPGSTVSCGADPVPPCGLAPDVQAWVSVFDPPGVDSKFIRRSR